MDTHRRLVYTDSAQARRQHLLKDLERRLDTAIMERKFVPGLDVVEVTASDVEELARSMQIGFRDRYDQRLRSRRLIVNAYLLLGTVTVAVGVFYDTLLALVQQPKQILLIGMGGAMVAAALFMRFYLDTRSRALEHEREYLLAMEERERRRREPEA